MSKKGSSFDVAAVRRITKATAKANGGQIPKDSFAGVAQRELAKSGGGTKGSTGNKK